VYSFIAIVTIQRIGAFPAFNDGDIQVAGKAFITRIHIINVCGIGNFSG